MGGLRAAEFLSLGGGFMWVEVGLWLFVSILIYIYAGYPAALILLSALRPARHQYDDGYTPPVTVLFSAYNEIASLPAKLDNLRALDYPKDKLQILIASDSSDDGTDEFLAGQPDIEFFPITTRGGKNAALNQLLPHASGEILLFTDANTLWAPGAVRAAVRHYSDPRVGVVTGKLIYAQGADWNAVGRGTGLYWRYENMLKQAENRLGSVLVGSGSVLSARRERVAPLDPRIANDLEIPIRIGALGDLVLFEPAYCGNEKPHTGWNEEWTRTSRIVARGLRGFWRLRGALLRSPLRLWQFISHKFLRWFTLPCALGAYACSAMLTGTPAGKAVFALGSLILAASLIGMALEGLNWSPPSARVCKLLGHFLWMQTAACWGLAQALLGRTPAAWNLPQSSR